MSKKYDVLVELFTPETNKNKLIERRPHISFHDVLENSYKNVPDPNAFVKQGYFMDKDLSTRDTQVYVRPSRKKLLVSTAGTRAIEGFDILTDFGSVVGYKSNRYSNAKNILEKARKKHNIKRAHLVGHSLGYMVSNAISEPQDEVIGYNGAWGYPTFRIPKSKRGFHIKDENDLLSMFSNGDVVMKSKDLPRLGNKGGHRLNQLYGTNHGNTDVFRIHN
jgi:hypothetical protein